MVSKVIILSGTSSAGKTSIAEKLQQKLCEDYLVIFWDRFADLALTMFSEDMKDHEDKFKVVMRKLSTVFPELISLIQNKEINLIVDTVIHEPILQYFIENFKNTKTYFIGVNCQLEELKRRENDREDRPNGIAESQFDKIHAHGIYDLTVDSTSTSAEQMASQIAEFIHLDLTPSAFSKLSK
ncbi:MAG: AAA family ATPase [Bacteriovoracaceae bacterium]|jgi:chloramphenicol 3-O phosphotransferase|nr:AAA family ATPase [Bacteriovoracaceae bacterium]